MIAEFNGLHNGVIDLSTGLGGRGYVGNSDVVTATDANGNFSIITPANLPNGFNKVRFVVVGQPDQPPLPGLSTQIDYTFRVDTTLPTIDTAFPHQSGASLPQDASISNLQTLSLFFTDPTVDSTGNPANNSPFAVPTQLSFFALDPATATNISNYQLINLGPDRQYGSAALDKDNFDESIFIKSATFIPTSNRGLRRTRTRGPFR